jgi:hypothetical protein
MAWYSGSEMWSLARLEAVGIDANRAMTTSALGSM